MGDQIQKPQIQDKDGKHHLNCVFSHRIGSSISFKGSMATSLSCYALISLFVLGSLPMISGCTAIDQNRLQFLNEDGVYLYQKGDYAHAKENFELALEMKPEDPGLIYNLAKCQEQLGQGKKAEETYRLCLEKDKNHAAARQALARLLFFEGRRGEAEDTVKGWLVSQPKLASAYAVDGWRLQQDGDLLKAQARLQQALDLDPRNVEALTQMGVLFELRERPDRALVLYERALQIAPNRVDLRERINHLLAKGAKQPLPDG